MRGVPRSQGSVFGYIVTGGVSGVQLCCVCRLVAISPTKLRGIFQQRAAPQTDSHQDVSCSVLSTCPAVCARSLLVHHLHPCWFPISVWYPVVSGFMPRTLLFEIQSHDRILRPCQEFTYPFFGTLCFCKKLLVYFIDFFTNCFSAFRPRPLGKHWRSIIDWHKLCSLRCVFDLYQHLEPAMILTILLLFYLSAPGGDDFQWFQCRTVSHAGCAAIFGRCAISDATK